MTNSIVAIVGRPNVGKSTLFNRLIGERIAIVEDLPGTTRDRIYGEAEWAGRTFTLIDTGGLEVFPTSEVSELVRAQVAAAVEESDVIVFLVELKTGATPVDLDIADSLRRSGKPVVVAVNKAESPQRRDESYEFYQLGLGEPIPVSALHGIGTGDLLDAIVSHLPAGEPTEHRADLVKLAIVGRPNVGKSSLLNAILGQSRSIVSEVPGTTRDAIDTYLDWEHRPIMLIDTAGIRRRGRIEVGVEHHSVLRALRAINRADVVALLIDAAEGMTAQDTHIAGYVREAYKGMAVIVNKWDLVAEKTTQTAVDYTRRIQAELKFMPYVPLIFISAKYGQRVVRVLPELIKIYDERQKRVPTGPLNRMIEQVVGEHAPPSERGRRLKILYATQADVNPPSFVFFVNDARLLHFSYERYLENRLREAFGFAGTPIKLVFRTRGEEER